MSPHIYNKRLNAIKVADAINKIEGVPVSQYAKDLSKKWARGEITGAQMKAALISIHKKEEQMLIEVIEQLDNITVS